ncbi:hypothetical protein [Actinopolyspora mortivallis]|uniref:Uncharacterized protein n=1 Tax=Actinopolyspora mortivallis TaxID=33906 RepID=A0A2T0H010_ACTMO|nr:hypothetical protein [Actinopolyspora mortivallis]PRW64694.1 hypothetical protein CEP50_04955 [Actinopolyspora mortivallis]
MSEYRTESQGEPAPEEKKPSRLATVDPIALTAGLLTVATSVYLLVGGTWTAQRALAFGAVAVGLLMLVSALRRR